MRKAENRKKALFFGFLIEYEAKHDHPPSMTEMRQALRVSSSATVNRYLDELERHGMVERGPDGPRISRSIRKQRQKGTEKTLRDKVDEARQVFYRLLERSRLPGDPSVEAPEPLPKPKPS